MDQRNVLTLPVSDPKKEMAPFDLLKRLPPPKTPEEFEARAVGYFQSGAALSVNALALAVGIKNHKRLHEWGRKAEFADVVEWSKGVLMAMLEADGAEDKSRMVMRIFQCKAIGLSDKGPDEGVSGSGNGGFADVFEQSAHAGAAGNVARTAEEV